MSKRRFKSSPRSSRNRTGDPNPSWDVGLAGRGRRLRVHRRVDVDAPQEAVFDALADARTYPEWWRPVYLNVDSDCEAAVGCVSRQEFKGSGR
jgi:hypothetical protein